MAHGQDPPLLNPSTSLGLYFPQPVFTVEGVVADVARLSGPYLVDMDADDSGSVTDLRITVDTRSFQLFPAFIRRRDDLYEWAWVNVRHGTCVRIEGWIPNPDTGPNHCYATSIEMIDPPWPSDVANHYITE